MRRPAHGCVTRHIMLRLISWRTGCNPARCQPAMQQHGASHRHASSCSCRGRHALSMWSELIQGVRYALYYAAKPYSQPMPCRLAGCRAVRPARPSPACNWRARSQPFLELPLPLVRPSSRPASAVSSMRCVSEKIIMIFSQIAMSTTPCQSPTGVLTTNTVPKPHWGGGAPKPPHLASPAIIDDDERATPGVGPEAFIMSKVSVPPFLTREHPQKTHSRRSALCGKGGTARACCCFVVVF